MSAVSWSSIHLFPECSFKHKPARKKPPSSYLKWTSRLTTDIRLSFSPTCCGGTEQEKKVSTFYTMCCMLKKNKNSLFSTHDIHNQPASNSYKCSFSLSTLIQCFSQENWSTVAYHNTKASSSEESMGAARVCDMQKNKKRKAHPAWRAQPDAQAQAWAWRVTVSFPAGIWGCPNTDDGFWNADC